ncbi:MAG: family 78 glycoside hydrolase catalytic domain [Promethearchaeota archaeon]
MKPPYNLRCEYLEDPINIDIRAPRFSWHLLHKERNQYQSAYQILVSSTRDLMESEEGDIWNTEKVESKKSSNIIFKGNSLNSNSSYFWRVKWWDKNDKESKFSDISSFETALLDKSEWKAEWITKKAYTEKNLKKEFQYKSGKRGLVGRLKEFYAIYLRKEFTLKKPIKKAKVYVCGLGYYELRINGEKVGNNHLDPAQTDYRKIALYSTFDITSSLRNQNAIGVILGNGRYIELFKFNYPKLIVQLHVHYQDGSTEIKGTDSKWKISGGPLIENGIYFGNNYDARLEMPGWDLPHFDDTQWENAINVNGHELASQLMEPIQVTEIIQPKKLYSPQAGVYVFDFKQNFAGFIRLKVCGPRGTRVQMRFSEVIFKDGTINVATNGNARATDVYILKGEGNEFYEPKFTYHGFRYVEITGFPGVPTLESIEGVFIHSNVEKIGDFCCSNNLINKIHKIILWGQLSNLMSIPTDCPQRDERQGWMGDIQLVTEESILNFNMARFFSKYMRDIKLCQKNDGSISDVVPPYWALYPADPAWGTAFITIAWNLYWYYNDIRILEENYEGMRDYIDFLISKTEGNLITFGKYGDWCPPGSIVSRKTPIQLTSSWYFYHDTLFLFKIAAILEKSQDEEFYQKKAENIKLAFNKKFLKSCYETTKLSPADRTISQTSNILPLYLDMVPEKKKKMIFSTLIETIKEDFDYHIDTGIIGTKYIFDLLSDNDHPEIAYKMISQESFPSYGYMIKEGATTLWERWEKLEGGGMNSHNHIMLGSVDTWFYKSLAGISCVTPGWETIRIKPFIPDDMEYVKASISTIKGLISCSWEKLNDCLALTIEVPIGCFAQIWIPFNVENSKISENGIIVWKDNNFEIVSKNIQYKGTTDKFVILETGSGFYQFIIQ